MGAGGILSAWPGATALSLSQPLGPGAGACTQCAWVIPGTRLAWPSTSLPFWPCHCSLLGQSQRHLGSAPAVGSQPVLTTGVGRTRDSAASCILTADPSP